MPVVGKVSGRYDAKKIEEEVKQFWEANKVYEKVREKTGRSDKVFNFIDGPPYPSGDIPHIGTAWNKTLKDVILRYKRMNGYRVFDRPGYDCHGLPIEVKVEQKLGVRVKREIEEKIGVDRFINECRELALNNLKSMTKWFRELGVFMDWENPYLTLTDDYIEAGWWLVKKAAEQGLLTTEERVVYWCPRCSTTLAEYEVEHHELVDPSIYVKFPVRGRSNEYLLIWTTTPWTLPANTFIMAHPEEDYVKIRVGGEYYILAEKRLEHVVREAGIKEYEVVERFKGSMLEGLEYDHPLEDIVPLQHELKKYHRVLMAPEFVTMHEGTGLVHGAPGHGKEDFTVARKYGIDRIASPIDDEARFTEEAGKYRGLYVRDANPVIIRDLKERGALLYESLVKHRYPVCWRCKTPVVQRATRQWVLKVSRLKDKLLEELDKVNWIPEWARDRTRHMIENIQDWVISRQRYWGTPLPVWICPEGHMLVIGSVKELEDHGGKRPKELHKPWIDEVTLKCPVCGREMRRVPDVMDVWFDSGIAFYAAKGHPEKLSLEDIILDFVVEGHDQTRGWFFSLLRSGVLGFGRAPYRNVLVHGFVLDEKGFEMHKSLGNYVGTDEAIERVGRDPLRFWAVQNITWEDARFSWKKFDNIQRDLGILWSTYVFASTYMNLDKYDPSIHGIREYTDALRIEDKWILSRINRLVKEVSMKLDNYLIHEAARLLRDFIVEDMSHWYIRLVRPRVWVEENTRDKLAAYTVIYYVLDRYLRLIAPFTPFLAEKLYQEVFRPAVPGSPVSVHLLEWPMADEEFIDVGLEGEMEIVKDIYEAAAAARMKAGLKLRQPVKLITIYTDREEIREVVEKHREIIKSLANTLTVEVKGLGELGRLVEYRVKPNYRVIGPSFRKMAPKVLEYIRRNEAVIAKDIVEKGVHKTVIDDAVVELTREHLSITPVYVEGYSVEERDWGSVAVYTRLTEEEQAMGLARDIVRRIQVMRKDLNLDLNAKIRTLIVAPGNTVKMIEKHREYIMSETRSSKLEILDKTPEKIEGYAKEWEIMGEKYLIAIVKIEE